MAKDRAIVGLLSSRRLRSNKWVTNVKIVKKPPVQARSAIATVERGPERKNRSVAVANVEKSSTSKIGSNIHGDSSLEAFGNDVPDVAATNNIQSIPQIKDSETLNTLVATNAMLADQLIENNKSFQQLEQKYIRALEQFYVERLRKLELQTKLDEQRCRIEKLEMKIVEIEDAAFCDDLIRLDDTRKKSSFEFDILKYT